MITNRDIICISSMDYEEHMTAKQQVMKLLAQNNRVFFFQREIGLEHIVKHPQLLKNILIRNFKNEYEIDGVKIIYLPVLLPGRYYSHAINIINQKRVARYIKKLYKKYKIKNPILWTFVPHSAPLFKELSADLKVYHCVENYNVMSTGRKKEIMQEQENELCKISDLIFCVTKGVYNKIKKIESDKSHLIYNGAPVELFNKSVDEHELPEDIMNIKGPKLLHMGMINGKVDLDLAINLAEKHLEWNLIFIGDIFYSDIDVQKYYKLKKMQNIFFLGIKKVEELPAYLYNIDVCLILGKKNQWTAITKPLKSYEYLASGKPVVSIGFPELEDFSEFVFISENYNEYEENIQNILTGKRKSTLEEQLEFSKQHSWTNRVEQMSRLISNVLQERK